MTMVIKNDKKIFLSFYIKYLFLFSLKRTPMLSHASKYALKALHYLVKNSSVENKVLSMEIASATAVPKPFLSKILQQLSMKDYVSSAKGRKGGFYLTEKQKERSILDIIIEVEGKDAIRHCILNLDHCDESNPCAIHHFVSEAKSNLHHSLKGIRLSDLQVESFD